MLDGPSASPFTLPRTPLSRRSLLLGSVGGAGLAALPTLPALADGEEVRDGSTAPTFGPASRATSLLCSLVYNGCVYVVTRNVVPAKVIEFDLAASRVTRVTDLPPSGQTTGDGAWAITESGGKLYVGTYPDARVHCFDPADGSVRTVGRCGSGNTFVFHLATGSDGMIFASTYNDGGLWQIDPATNTITKLGSPLQGAQYGRFVGTQGDRWVYFGVYLPITLMRYDRYTGEFADITPPQLKNQVYGPFKTTDQYLYSVGNGRLVRMNLDGTDAMFASSPPGDGVGQLVVTPDGTVYGSGNRSGTLYRWVPGGALTPATVPVRKTGIVGLQMADETTVVGGLNLGAVFTYDIGTNEMVLTSLVNAGYAGAAEPPQAIAADANNPDLVYVGGNAGIQIHQPSTQTSFRIPVPGELKTVSVIEGSVYSALYISGEIVRIDPDRQSYEVVAALGGGQVRPGEARFHPRTRNLAIASGPGTGQLIGALSLFNIDTHLVQQFRNILPDESLLSVWVDKDVAYIAGDIRGGQSVPPTRPRATVGAFDLLTRELLWTVEPLPEAVAIQSVAVLGNTLYGVCRIPAGRWFALDLATRRVVREGALSAHGRFEASVGQLYLVTEGAGQIYRMAPGRNPKLLWDNIGNSWFTVPQIVPVAGTTRKFWGLYQTDLAQFDLDIDT